MSFEANSGKKLDTLSLSLSFPFSINCKIEVAVDTGLVIEAISNTVSRVMGLIGSRERFPNAR